MNSPPQTLFREEANELIKLGVPAMATNLFATLMLLVDSVFLGHLGPTELAAASLGSAYWNVVWCAARTLPSQHVLLRSTASRRAGTSCSA